VCLSIVISLLLAAAIQCAAASDTGVVYLSFAPVDADFINRLPQGNGIAGLSGNIVALGQFNDAAFSVSGTEEIGVIGPDGTNLPVHIDKNSMGVEFGRLVSARLAFPLQGDPLQEQGRSYRLVWGPGRGKTAVAADNWTVDPDATAMYRVFRWTADPATNADSQLASIEVIADSQAGYYSLWYLVPMALIFALLTIRKLHP